VLALDALHRQVMPFVLRRTKGQVLADLPPKTVQDIVVEPSALQRALYEDFATSEASPDMPCFAPSLPPGGALMFCIAPCCAANPR
jgi:SNF2 family DNA or RNA helicase